MKGSCKMPEEMALEILSRLPPKCLVRFKCVHKSWYSLINNPSFIAMHLANGMHNNSSTCLLLKRLAVKDTDTEEKETLFSLLNISNDSADAEADIDCVVEEMTKGQFIGLKVLESSWIVGHCDGIICLADLRNVIMLLNPAIMEFKLVKPEPCVEGKTLNVGFGYDTKSKNYKVVNIFPLDVETYGRENIIFNPPKIEVYTSGTDSWRQIMTDSLETETTNFCLDSFHIYFQGFGYWTGREQLKEYTSDENDLDGGNIRQVIMSFDMSDDVFQNILVPDGLHQSYFCWYDIHLIVWNESIAILCLDGDITPAESLGLWLMADFGGAKGSWIKQFTFERVVGIVKALRFWNSDEILMDSEERGIVSYNLDTEKNKYLLIRTVNSNDFQVVPYVASMVTIKVSSHSYGEFK